MRGDWKLCAALLACCCGVDSGDRDTPDTAGSGGLEETDIGGDTADTEAACPAPRPMADTDQDGLPDEWEPLVGTRWDAADSDGDGVMDAADHYLGFATDADHDADGLNDASEYQWSTLVDRADSDWDGLLDGPEVDHGLHPMQVDSDQDGWFDGAEWLARWNPTVSGPGGPLPGEEEATSWVLQFESAYCTRTSNWGDCVSEAFHPWQVALTPGAGHVAVPGGSCDIGDAPPFVCSPTYSQDPAFVVTESRGERVEPVTWCGEMDYCRGRGAIFQPRILPVASTDLEALAPSEPPTVDPLAVRAWALDPAGEVPWIGDNPSWTLHGVIARDCEACAPNSTPAIVESGERQYEVVHGFVPYKFGARFEYFFRDQCWQWRLYVTYCAHGLGVCSDWIWGTVGYFRSVELVPPER